MSIHPVSSSRIYKYFSGNGRQSCSSFYLLSLIIFSGAASTGYSVTVQMTPAKDNSIYSENSNSNGKGTGLFAGITNKGATRRALVAFNMDSIPAGATIDSVSLRMVVTQTQVGNETATLHRLRSDWGEGTSSGSGQGAAPTTGDATWTRAFFNTVSWTAGGDFVAQASATSAVGSSAVTWSSNGLVADVQGWVNGQDNFGWLLQVDESGRSAKQFASRESGTSANRPTLTIEYTLPKSDQTITFNEIPSQILERGALTMGATATSGLDVGFSVISGPSTLEGDVLLFTGAGTVTVRASQAGDDTFNPAAEVDQSFDIINAIDTWLLTYFLGDELSQPSIAGDDADPDKDGLLNVVEYALGLNPRVPSSLFVGDEALAIGEGGDSLVLTFSRNPEAFDASIIIEESFDLATWTSVATSVNGSAFQPTLAGYVVSETSGEGVMNVRLASNFTSLASNFQRIRVVR